MVNWFYFLSLLSRLVNLDIEFVVVLAALMRVLWLWGWSESGLSWDCRSLGFKSFGERWRPYIFRF
jgi:hypothetical protein